jgi:hypothetical protein
MLNTGVATTKLQFLQFIRNPCERLTETAESNIGHVFRHHKIIRDMAEGNKHGIGYKTSAATIVMNITIQILVNCNRVSSRSKKVYMANDFPVYYPLPLLQL